MVPSVELSAQTFARLQAHAVPLVDNIETVIGRLIDFYESRDGAPVPTTDDGAGGKVRQFNPLSPPSLTHTKVLAIEFCGRLLEHGQGELERAAQRRRQDGEVAREDRRRPQAVRHYPRSSTGRRPTRATDTCRNSGYRCRGRPPTARGKRPAISRRSSACRSPSGSSGARRTARRSPASPGSSPSRGAEACLAAGSAVTFSRDCVQAVNDWQRGGDHRQKVRRGEKLRQEVLALPEAFRICTQQCFRQEAHPKGRVWQLLADECLPETIAAWTTDLAVAKHFKGGVPPHDLQGVIFALVPPARSVVANLAALYANADFLAAVETFKLDIRGFVDGIGKYGGSQTKWCWNLAA